MNTTIVETLRGAKVRVKLGDIDPITLDVPARTLRNISAAAEPGFGPLQIHDPHSGQTHRLTVRPLAAMRWIIRGSTPVRRNAPSLTTITIENALLVMRWQSRQWHA